MEGARAAAVPQFVTAQVVRGDVVSRVTATGTLSATVTVQVGTQVSGRISTLSADFNSEVKRSRTAECEVTIVAAGNIDTDPAIDVWSSSTAPRTIGGEAVPRACPSTTSTTS